MKIDWKSLKKFIDDTKLYKIVNYIELDTGYYVWISYEGETFSSMLEKGSVDCNVFISQYKPLAILKDDLAPDGVKFSRSMLVFTNRLFHCLFVKITTSITQTNDKTGYVTVRTRDEQKQITSHPSKAVYTEVDFCLGTGIDCSLFGGSIEFLETINSDIVFNAILAPDIPSQYGGNIIFVQNMILRNKTENQIITRKPPNAGDVKTNNIQGVNVLRFELKHDVGLHKDLQLEFQYFV